MASVRQGCLAPDDLIPSMELGDLVRARAIQGLKSSVRARFIIAVRGNPNAEQSLVSSVDKAPFFRPVLR